MGGSEGVECWGSFVVWDAVKAAHQSVAWRLMLNLALDAVWCQVQEMWDGEISDQSNSLEVRNLYKYRIRCRPQKKEARFYSVAVITPDSDSGNPGSSPGRTSPFVFFHIVPSLVF